MNLLAYRGHQVRKKVADDKSQVQLEAFIIKFQAGTDSSIHYLYNTGRTNSSIGSAGLAQASFSPSKVTLLLAC